MGNEFSCFGISCPCRASNHTNVRILPFDQGPPEGLITCTSSLDCLPFDHGPDQLLTPGNADNPILFQVTEACSFCISDCVFFLAFWMMDLSFVQMFWQMFDKIFAMIRFFLFQKDEINASSLVSVRGS